MRTNIVINPDLLKEAMRYTRAKTKKAVIEEALLTFVQVKEREQRTLTYRERLKSLDKRLADLRLRQSPSTLLREDRETR